MASKFAEEIIEVVRILKRDLFKELDKLEKDETITEEQADELTRSAFKKCANLFDVTESTIRSRCTRELGLTTAEFFKMVRDWICKANIDLEKKVVEHKTAKDGNFDVAKALRDARE